MFRKLAVLLFFAVGSLLLAPVLHAQSGQITGDVRDASGGVVVKAAVRIINQATLVERHTATNDVGIYAVPYLDPGKYQVVVEAPNFQTSVTDVTLTVDQVLVLNLQLKIGEASIKIEVKMPDQPIDLNDAQVSQVVDSRQMNALPLILRDPYQLVTLVAGVNPSDNQGSGGFAVNGGRTTANNFRLDGADGNEVEGSGQIATINPESTREFRVITNNYLPEYGRDNGAVIDVVTQSGTNQLHGGVYEYGRWAVLGARDYFNGTGTPKDGYTRNIFGGTLGGPIIKDKTFFFLNYEGQRWATTRTNSSFAPTAGFVAGQFTYSGFDDKTGLPFTAAVDVSTPNSQQNQFHLPLDQTIQQILSHLPTVPDAASPDGIVGQISFPSPDYFSGNNFTLKIDHNFSSSEALSLRYVGNPSKDSNVGHSDTIPGIGFFPSTSVNQLGAAHLVSTFSGTLLNDFIFGINHVHSAFACGSRSIIDSVRTPDRFGNGTDFSLEDQLPTWGCPAQTNGFTESSGTYSWSDHVVWIRGHHTTKFGFEAAALHSNTTFGLFSRTQASFSNFFVYMKPAIVINHTSEILQDSLWMLFGEPTFQTQAQFFTPGGTRLPTDIIHMRENDFSIFWQDNFKVNSNFTFNYGLRWELNGAPYETNNLISTASLATLSGPAPVVFHVASGSGQSLYPADRFALQPRISFAWDPFGTGKTSIRGAYGVFRDHLFFSVGNTVRGNPPLTEQQTQFVFTPNTQNGFSGTPISTLPVPPDFAPTTSVPQLAGIFSVTVDPNLHLPYSQNWNFGVQRDLPGNIQIEANYVGVQTKRLLQSLDGNPPDPAKVAALRQFCQNPSNSLGCQDSPSASDVQGNNLYFGAETPGPLSTATNFVPLLPFDAVNNNAIDHAQVIQTGASSTYNALQATVTKRYSNGVFIQGAYTWSHEIDDAAGPFAPSANNVIFPPNSHDLRQERGNGAQDVRHVLVIDFTADLPFGRGTSRLNHGLIGKALEGWTFAGIVRFQGGFPYDIFELRDSQGTGIGGQQRPDYNRQGTPIPVLNQRTQTGPNAGLFSSAAFGTVGNLHRNVFRVPGINNSDVSLIKHTRLTERVSMDFRAEAYNLFNRVQFTPPFNLIDFPSFFGQSFGEVGRPDGTTGARQMQLALKLNF
jgi:hypothetical protein